MIFNKNILHSKDKIANNKSSLHEDKNWKQKTKVESKILITNFITAINMYFSNLLNTYVKKFISISSIFIKSIMGTTIYLNINSRNHIKKYLKKK